MKIEYLYVRFPLENYLFECGFKFRSENKLIKLTHGETGNVSTLLNLKIYPHLKRKFFVIGLSNCWSSDQEEAKKTKVKFEEKC